MSSKMMPRSGLAAAIGAALAAAPVMFMPHIALAQTVDLGNLGERGFRIEGIEVNGQSSSSGFSVSGAGDVNGDGLADLIIGAPGADSSGDLDVGESYVVFGKASTTVVALSNLGTGGFQIKGIDEYDRSGSSVSGAGDVNGDGLADLVVGARNANSDGNYNAGESYVVFGKASSTPVDLANLGAGGFRIGGLVLESFLGQSVSGAGDVNGDGLADLIVGAPRAQAGGNSSAGQSYVVFGKASSLPVDLANLGTGGFRIDGIDALDRSGESVAGAGDVNGDGLADLIVGARNADPDGNDDAGESYVVFGKANSVPVDLANLGTAGFRINGIDVEDYSGISVSGAGDVNGDGLADLIVGAWMADPGGDYDAGESYVVFGKANSATVLPGTRGWDGFRIDGINDFDLAGRSVAGAGDVNGDGLADLIVGAYTANPGGNNNAGESYVVFGKTSDTSVQVSNLGTGGFRIAGIEVDDLSGRSVSGAGDVNGDGLADLIVGAWNAEPGGESYVIFSTAVPLLETNYRVRNRNGNAPQIAVGVTGDGSNDDSPDARFWIDFSDGNDLLTAASTEIVTLSRTGGPFTGSAANVSWRLQTTRENWSSAEVTVRYLDSELQIADEDTLRLFFSSNGSAPFSPLSSVVNPLDNTISAHITQSGFLYIGLGEPSDVLFTDSFE